MQFPVIFFVDTDFGKIYLANSQAATDSLARIYIGIPHSTMSDALRFSLKRGSKEYQLWKIRKEVTREFHT